MVHPYSMRIPRVRIYSGYCHALVNFAYKTLTSFGSPSQVIRLSTQVTYAVLTPFVFLLTVWPLSLSLATTHKISVDFFSYSYLDVSVRNVPHV